MDEDDQSWSERPDGVYLEAFLLIGDYVHEKKRAISPSELYAMMRERFGISGGVCPDIVGRLQCMDLIKIEQNNGTVGYMLNDDGAKLYAELRGLEYRNEEGKDGMSSFKNFLFSIF